MTKVELVLSIFGRAPEVEAGQVLTVEQITHAAAARLLDVESFLAGMKLAVREGYIEAVPPAACRLTEAGSMRLQNAHLLSGI